ncbi:hypothetical protein [Streptomyces sp. NPDC005303]
MAHPIGRQWMVGHSIAVLYRFYAKILKGGQQQSNRPIARALDEG